eukprot:403375505
MEFTSKTDLPKDCEVNKLESGLNRIKENNSSMLRHIEYDEKNKIKSNVNQVMTGQEYKNNQSFDQNHNDESFGNQQQVNFPSISKGKFSLNKSYLTVNNSPSNNSFQRRDSFMLPKSLLNQTINSKAVAKQSCSSLQQLLVKSQSIRSFHNEDETNSPSPKGLWERITQGNQKIVTLKKGRQRLNQSMQPTMGSVQESSIQLERDPSSVFITEAPRLPQLKIKKNIYQNEGFNLQMIQPYTHKNTHINTIDIDYDMDFARNKSKHQMPKKYTLLQDVLESTRKLSDRKFQIVDDSPRKNDDKKKDYRASSLKLHKSYKSNKTNISLSKEPSTLLNSSFNLQVNNQKLMQKIYSNIQEAKEVRSYLNQSIQRIKEDVKFDSIEEKIKRFEQFDFMKVQPFKPRLSIKVDRVKQKQNVKDLTKNILNSNKTPASPSKNLNSALINSSVISSENPSPSQKKNINQKKSKFFQFNNDMNLTQHQQE